MPIAQRVTFGTKVSVFHHSLPDVIIRLNELQIPLDSATLTVVSRSRFSIWKKVKFEASYKGSTVFDFVFRVLIWNMRSI